MGNIVSNLISVTYEVIISRGVDCTVGKAKYICELEDNLDDLQNELQKLIEARNDVKTKVTIAEQKQLKQTEQVEGWLSRVQDAEAKVGELLEVKSQEIEKLCLGGYCSRNCKSSYKFGEKVAKMLQVVATLKDEGAFEAVAEKAPETAMDERPIEPAIVGLESTFDKVWRCLAQEQPGIIGLYGMGGVGKTTLLTQINNKLCQTPSDFNLVIWVEVSRDLQLEKIQKTVGEKIGLIDESWESRTLENKALDIFKILSKKKFVLLLDDIWERVDLIKLGVPLPNSGIASKVVFTTRFLDVCGHMEAYKKFKVECLAEEEAWKLFLRKVGEDTLGSHPEIPALAKVVAKECGGLPLALIVIGRAMSCKTTPEEWRDALHVLKKPTFEFPGMGKEVYPLLKFSYDSLPNDKIRLCLLYCSLFSEDWRIAETDLIDCWVGEGFLDDYEGSREQDQGYSIIGVLTRACLLEEVEISGVSYVKMHDVIRDMSLWIACHIELEKENFLVHTGLGLIEAPKIKEWEGVRRISLISNRIENFLEFPTCPLLLTLFLTANSLKTITSDFFQHMPSLKVLKLNSNPLTKLPLSIPNLVSLQYLDLSATKIKELPIELKALVNLKCLDLEHMQYLHAIPRGLISSFLKLHLLRMYRCSLDVSDEAVADDSILFGGSKILVEEMIGLKFLNKLSIHLRSFNALQRFLSSVQLQSGTQYLSLQFSDSKSLSVSSLSGLKHLSQLCITRCKYLEEFKIGRVIQESYGFHNLCQVRVEFCSNLRDLTWISFLQNLTILHIRGCDEMEEIITCGKLSEVPEMMGSLNPFGNLRRLSLVKLPNLKSIYRKALTFPHLNLIIISACPKLKKLPLNSNSAKECKIVIQGEEHWWKELQWDDEATQTAFLPCFKSISD